MTSSTGETPAQRMIGRQLRSRLDLLKETSVEEYSDDYGQPNCRFHSGDAVMARDFRKPHLTQWTPGVVIQPKGSRACLVQVDQGKITLHVDHLRRRANEVRFTDPVEVPIWAYADTEGEGDDDSSQDYNSFVNEEDDEFEVRDGAAEAMSQAAELRNVIPAEVAPKATMPAQADCLKQSRNLRTSSDDPRGTI